MKNFIDRTKGLRNIKTLGSFFNDLARLTLILPMVEQGKLTDNEHRDMTQCVGVERDTKDPGFGWASFRFMGFVVRLAFCDGGSGTSVQFISTVTLHVNGEEVVVTHGDMEALNFHLLAKWKPSNLMYWMNMAWVWEARQVKAPR